MKSGFVFIRLVPEISSRAQTQSGAHSTRPQETVKLSDPVPAPEADSSSLLDFLHVPSPTLLEPSFAWLVIGVGGERYGKDR